METDVYVNGKSGKQYIFNSYPIEAEYYPRLDGVCILANVFDMTDFIRKYTWVEVVPIHLYSILINKKTIETAKAKKAKYLLHCLVKEEQISECLKDIDGTDGFKRKFDSH